MKNVTNDLSERIDFLKKVLTLSKKIDNVKELLSNDKLRFNTVNDVKTIEIGCFWDMYSTNRIFDFYTEDISHFVKMYKLWYDEEHPLKKELISAKRFLDKFYVDYKRKDVVTIEYLKQLGFYC